MGVQFQANSFLKNFILSRAIMNIKNILLLIFLPVIVCGCATMVDGSTQKISIDSNPQGATILVGVRVKSGHEMREVQTKSGRKKLKKMPVYQILNKREAGKTPAQVIISRKDGAILLEKEGYEAVEVPLVRGTNPAVWLDVLATSLLSTSIDASTGAINEYDPDKYLVEMKPAGSVK
jgi:hypothetical protein